MTTITPDPRKPHEHRQIAESFGGDAERYDRTRPHYPAALVERILAAIPGRDVLDVGCGTGIAARQFQSAGSHVLGVEPDERMADLARRNGTDVDVATFETWDPAGRTFDAIIAATAWHWVDPVAGAAKAAQLLRPGGQLAVFWNAAEQPAEVTTAFTTAYQRVAPDSPFNVAAAAARSPLDPYEPLLTIATEGIRTAGGFGDPERWQLDWHQHYTRDEWLDQMPSQGTLTRLPPDQLRDVLDEVGAAIDGIGGGFEMAYHTMVVIAQRTEVVG